MKRLVVIAAILAPSPSRADKAAAEAAFLQAKQLDSDGKVAEACAMYLESYRAEPALGALLNVADCHERLGRLATAWAEFHDAEELAGRLGDARATYARERADRIFPRLSKLRVEQPPANVTVRRDGEQLATWIALPIDAGEHTVEASAAGYETWRTTVIVRDDAQTTTVTIPPLVARAVPAPAAGRDPAIHVELDDSARHRRRLVALAIAGGAVAALGVSVAFGADANNVQKGTKTDGQCDQAYVCTAQGAQALSRAIGLAHVADGFAIASGAAVIGAIVVYTTAPAVRRIERRVTFAPVVGRHHLGAFVSHRF